MKSILQSIKPQYCELIASGKKTIEVRKTRPKLDVPFKVYIYMTKSNLVGDRKAYKDRLAGKVIGEYVCDGIKEITADNLIAIYFNNPSNETCLNDLEMRKYANGKNLFLWHISDLKIYDKPKELREFVKYDFALDYEEWEHYAIAGINRKEPDINDYRLTHPPESWCYVEEV